MAKRLTQRNLGVVILAAGKATRMESDVNKVLHPVAGEIMLSYVLETAKQLHPSKIAIVIGHQGKQVKKAFSTWLDIEWIWQKKMLGTGDAVRCTSKVFENFLGSILVLYGDIPGIRVETLRRLAMVHSSSPNVITLLTAELDDPTHYGRILLAPDGTVSKIVEEKDATEEEKEINEINTGIGFYDAKFLFSALKELRPNNKQREFYLTDLVAIARKGGFSVGRLRVSDNYETLGINDRESLAEVSRIFYDDKATQLLRGGVTFRDPATTSISPKSEIGRDTVIGGGVEVQGRSKIGQRVEIHSGSLIVNSEIGTGVRLGRHVSVKTVKIGTDTVIGSNTTIGSRED